jgi:hypothetical protein
MLFVPLLGALLAFTSYFAWLYFSCFTSAYGVLDVPLLGALLAFISGSG